LLQNSINAKQANLSKFEYDFSAGLFSAPPAWGELLRQQQELTGNRNVIELGAPRIRSERFQWRWLALIGAKD